jgi:ATP-dependent DNA helicase RecG
MKSKINRKFMQLAIKEARKSNPESDNRIHPKVGVVVVKNNRILGKGSRGELCAGEHAEYTILERKLKDKNLKGTILYTTLEPCTTRKHPKIPCAKWIVKRRIAMVVIGMLDPNHDICGRGVWFLRNNKVKVEYFPSELQSKVEEMNRDYISQFRKEPSSFDENSLMEASSTYEKGAVYAASIDDLSVDLIQFYLSKINMRLEIPSKELWRFFVKKGFAVMARDRRTVIPTVAGILLFNRKPETYLVQNKIKAAFFRGSEQGETIDYQDINCSLPAMIDETVKFFKRNMRSAMRIEGFTRVEISEYPTEALREAIRNAIVHRDYNIEGATIFVKMFQDRIVVESPGLLPRPLTLDKIRKLNYVPIWRNALITRAMSDMGFIEERGGGIRRMHDFMLNHGLREPEFKYNSGYFSVTFYGPSEKILELHPKEVNVIYAIEPAKLALINDRQKEIMKLLLKLGRISSAECTSHFKITRDTANRDFRRLIELELIELKGKGRATYYVLKKK